MHRSPNGDRLRCSPAVLKPVGCSSGIEPNLPSGGQVVDIELGAFLIAAGNGPEKQELLRLIGTLI